MKFWISIISFLLATAGIGAQNELSGTVLSPDQEPVEFASVSVYPMTDNTQVIGVITNQKGLFTISGLISDSFLLTVQMLGYENWSRQVNVSENLKLEAIILKEDVAILEEVQVVAYQSVVESHLGKKVLRIGKDLTLTGSNALEALSTIPSVTTTPRGQIQIRGNANVVVYINGKPTRRDPSSLRFISAESLERIEIITNPSAKYDAEGVGGIIDLVYKKDENASFKLELVSNLTVLADPFFLNFSEGVNANWTKKKFSFFTNLSYEYGGYEDYLNSTRLNFRDSLRQYQNLTTDKGLGKIGNALFGFSIQPDSTTSIGLEVNYDRWDIDNNVQQRNIFDYRDAPDKEVTLPSRRVELENELWVNIALEKEFKNKKTLKISLTAGGENEVNFSESEEVDLTGLPSNFQQFLRSSEEKEVQRYYTGVLDYSAPFFNWGTIETGLKADYIQYDIFQRIALRSASINVPDNEFDMSMQKLGVYALQKKQIDKLEYALGLRLEQFKSDAIQRADGSTFLQDYVRVFPSVQLIYLIADHDQTIGLNYTKRINRPGFFDLNPYVSYEDPLNLETGNPALRPEIADLLELNYHQEWKKMSFDLTLYNRSTNDAIQSVVTPLDGNRSLETSVNIGSERSRGIEGLLDYRVNKDFKVSGAFVLAQNKYEDGESEISYNQQTTSSVRLNQQLSLRKNWKVVMSEVYQAPTYQIQRKRHQNFYVNIALSKKLNKKRGSLSLSIRDLFNTRQFAYSLLTSSFEVERDYKWQTRQITLGLKYVLVDKKR